MIKIGKTKIEKMTGKLQFSQFISRFCVSIVFVSAIIASNKHQFLLLSLNHFWSEILQHTMSVTTKRESLIGIKFLVCLRLYLFFSSCTLQQPITTPKQHSSPHLTLLSPCTSRDPKQKCHKIHKIPYQQMKTSLH